MATLDDYEMVALALGRMEENVHYICNADEQRALASVIVEQEQLAKERRESKKIEGFMSGITSMDSRLLH